MLARAKLKTGLELKVLAQQHEIIQDVSRSIRSLRSRELVGARDFADASETNYQQGLELQLAEIRSREAQRLETTIQAIETEQYGICRKCQAEIPVKRLEAMPSATLCTSCQTEEEETAS
ncbi:MAG TPA: TraR/DksA C4-type zinc finger protein [Candidatus Paceibacterota bacterium]|nr:TraR/DksA C4-type zinc finger protein [Candidatus Paceibacterota bacterium]